MHSVNWFFGQKVFLSKGNLSTWVRAKCISAKGYLGQIEFGIKVIRLMCFRSTGFEESVFGQPVFGLNW